MFEQLEQINTRPGVWSCYTAKELWTDAHTSKKMLEYHLNPDIDVSSRNAAFIKRSVAWLTDSFDVKGKKVADFGCGPGLYASALAEAGAKVTGIDFSANSIAYAKEQARKRNLDINYVNEDYLAFDTDEKFDLIIMIFCDFCALSPGQRRQLLQRFNNLLAQGGQIVLDVFSLAAYGKREEQSIYEPNQLNGFWSPERYYGFVNTFKYDDEKVVLDKYTIIQGDGTKTVYNWLQYFDTEAIKKEFSGCGLEVKAFYSDVAGSPFDTASDEFAVVARRIN